MTGDAVLPPRPSPEFPEQDPRPIVAPPRQGMPGAAIATIALLLAVLLFIALDAQRRRAAQGTARTDRSQVGAFASPPPLVVPPEPAPAPAPPAVTVVTTPAPVPPSVRIEPAPLTKTPPFTAAPYSAPPPPVIVPQVTERPAPRLNEPALVVDGGADQVGSGPAAPTLAPGQGGAGSGSRAGGPGTSGDDTPARATLIGNRTTIMSVGTLIPAVLETPIDTARPGLVRAVVSQDTRGFDGRRVLVPRGSRLIGDYQSDVRPGQNRVLVTWTRLIRPDGVAIRLGSPAADPLGGAGVPGHVHSFFFQRFASAVLQSALTVGVNLASRPGSGSVILGLPNTAGNVGQSLLPANDLRPKITVKQGAAMNVFVARDLDFSGVPSRP